MFELGILIGVVVVVGMFILTGIGNIIKRKKGLYEQMSDTKKCPYCAEEIKIEATKCRFCGEWLETSETEPEDETSQPTINETKQKNTEKEQSTATAKEKRSFLKRVPGFRSNKMWKKAVAIVGYFFIFIFIIGIFAGEPPEDNDEAPVEEETAQEKLVPDEIRLTEDFENAAEETKAKNAEEWPRIVAFIDTWNGYIEQHTKQLGNDIASEQNTIGMEDVKMSLNHDKAARYKHKFSDAYQLTFSMRRDSRDTVFAEIKADLNKITDDQEALNYTFSRAVYLASYFDDVELENTGAIIDDMGLMDDLYYDDEYIRHEYKEEVEIVFDSFRGETDFYVAD